MEIIIVRQNYNVDNQRRPSVHSSTVQNRLCEILMGHVQKADNDSLYPLPGVLW